MHGELNVFVINRNWLHDTSLELDVSGFKGYDFIEQIQLYSDDFEAANSYDDPNVITPSVNTEARMENGSVMAVVKMLSWNVFRFKKR